MVKGRDQTSEEEAEDHKKLLKMVNEPGFENKLKLSFAKSKEKMRENKALSETEEKYKRFIFDESKVMRRGDFVFMKINPDLIGIGVYMPKEKDLYDKKNGFLGSTQESVPCIITSDRELVELNSLELEKKHKIKIGFIPDESAITRRWNLTSIQFFLSEKESKINLKDVLSEIKEVYKKYLFFNNDLWYWIHALWDVSTYFYLLFEYFPILELRGYSGTAKSKIMTISRLFSFNPSQEMTNPSEATLFREQRKTRYIDEAEKIFAFNPRTNRVEQDTRAEIINSGYKRTGCVPRQEKINDRFVTMNYMTFAPQMIASINGLYGATENRSIVHITTKAPAGDPRMQIEPDDNDPQYNAIRCKLYFLMMQSWKEFEYAYQHLEKKTNLKERDYWLWKPILILANEADPELYEEIREFAEKQTEIKRISRIEAGSLKYWIFKIVNNLLEDGKTAILLNEVIKSLPTQYANTHNKTAAIILDKIGFYEDKAKSRDGVVYNLTLDRFKNVISAEFPDIFTSFASLESQSNTKEQELSDANVTQTTIS